MPETTSFAAAIIVGFLGSSHCLAMCGGIVGALSMALPQHARSGLRLFGYTLAYNLGRITSYMLAGALIGALSQSLTLTGQIQAVAIGLRLVAAIFLVLMGLYLSGWWPVLTVLEKHGAKLWRHISPYSKRLLPLDTPLKAFSAGALWGWLPCGLTYSALGFSLSAGSASGGAWLMLGFGLGTLPAMLALGTFAERLRHFSQQRSTRLIAAGLLLALGLWTGAQALRPHGHHGAHPPSATSHEHSHASMHENGHHSPEKLVPDETGHEHHH